MIDASKLGTNHPVFTILLEENPGLFTTDGLERLLIDCVMKTVDPSKIAIHHSLVHECIWVGLSAVFESPGDLDLMRRILVSPSEFDVAPSKELTENNFYSRIGSLFGADMMTNKFVYDVIRDNIHAIQNQLNISGIRQHHRSIRDRVFCSYTPSGYLDLLESDRVILHQEIPKVVKFFLKVISIDEQYELFRQDDEEELHYADNSEVWAIARIAVDAHIRSESNKWTKTNNGWSGTRVEKIHPDSIVLSLGLSGDESTIFEAIHIDKSRHPWLEE
jgi:hypothetical protein